MSIYDKIRPALDHLPLPTPADAMLMDVARRVQLSPTKHDEAAEHFEALCAYVDRAGSPLENKVIACYPGGSFATGTAIASSVSKDQHDVDVVMELDIAPESEPRIVLDTLFVAINGEPGSRYYGRVKLNSRCVTVTYEDGVRVDLMPIARLTGEPSKAGHLFHSRPEHGESFHKPVNPWGFADHFNSHTAYDPIFAAVFETRTMDHARTLAKAQTDPLPERVPLSEKSARVVALQLIKRNRDIRFRTRSGRKPPSIVLATFALEVQPLGTGLSDEIISITTHMVARLQEQVDQQCQIDMRNPAYRRDVFTDRWPDDVTAQTIYIRDLQHLGRQLSRLRNENASLTEMKLILDDLFGETPAKFAIEQLLDSSRKAIDEGTMRFGSTGKVLTGAAATVAAATSSTARASTNMGGGWLED